MNHFFSCKKGYSSCSTHLADNPGRLAQPWGDTKFLLGTGNYASSFKEEKQIQIQY